MLTNPDPVPKKRRRVQRACDKCRAKKIKCEEGDGVRCANCIDYNIECTQTEPPKKRGPKSHIDSLQQRVHKMESMLQKIGVESEPSRSSSTRSVPSGSSVLEDDELTALTAQVRGPTLNDNANSGSDSEKDTLPDDLDHVDLNAQMKHLSLGHHENRFFGQASGFVFLHKALDIKKQLTKREQSGMLGSDDAWAVQPWELKGAEEEDPSYVFPEQDLMDDLVALYFERVNIYFPVLHRPTFFRSLHDGLHLRDHRFGALVLLCLALASRFSNNPQVLWDGVNDWRSSGWKWFCQVRLVPKTFLRTSSLCEVQKICLASMYLHGASAPQAVWTLVGVGLRFIQERGIHRRKRPDHVWTVEDELWKRSFWALLCLDRICCSILGRPCSIHDEDFDVEMPFECDDEYWENPDPLLAFKQPEDKPSTMAYFTAHIRIFDILAFILRTVYSVGKYKASMAKLNAKWEEDAMRKIDSALNKWLDLLPPQLKWPTQESGTTFYYQSATLYITYYYVQIQAHRPFIPAIGETSPLSLPSLVICANAARSCSHILASLLPHDGVVIQPFLAPAGFTSGIFLLLHVWVGKKNGFPIDISKELENVRHCLRYLKKLQSRYQIVARFCSILGNLIAQEEEPSPPPTSEPANHPSPLGPQVSSSLEQPVRPPQQVVKPVVNGVAPSQPVTNGNGSMPHPSAYQNQYDPNGYSPSFHHQQMAYDLAQLTTDPMDLYRVWAGPSAPPDHYGESWINFPMATSMHDFMPNYAPGLHTTYQNAVPQSYPAPVAEQNLVVNGNSGHPQHNNHQESPQQHEWPHIPLDLGAREWQDFSFRFNPH